MIKNKIYYRRHLAVFSSLIFIVLNSIVAYGADRWKTLALHSAQKKITIIAYIDQKSLFGEKNIFDTNLSRITALVSEELGKLDQSMAPVILGKSSQCTSGKDFTNLEFHPIYKRVDIKIRTQIEDYLTKAGPCPDKKKGFVIYSFTYDEQNSLNIYSIDETKKIKIIRSNLN